MSNLVKHAEYELRKAGLFDKDSDYGGNLAVAVMSLVKAHAEYGHSGGSHGAVMEIFNRVANFKTLTPITSNPEEWMQVADEMLPNGDGPMWQNKRQSSAFSQDGGKTWYDIADPKAGTTTRRR